jgi:hypothetical protein
LDSAPIRPVNAGRSKAPMDYPTFLLDQHGLRAILTLNPPDRLNAWTLARELLPATLPASELVAAFAGA